MVNPKSKAGYKLGIVNPLTLVGNEIRSILRERSLPVANVAMLDSSGASVGALTEMDDEPAVVAAISDAELEDLDLAFFCGPAASNDSWVERCRPLGVIAVDLSQPAVEHGKLVVAGINLDEVELGDVVLVSPHPAAIPLALILHQLQYVSSIELVTATIVQPASELGQAAVEELAQQTIAVLNVTSGGSSTPSAPIPPSPSPRAISSSEPSTLPVATKCSSAWSAPNLRSAADSGYGRSAIISAAAQR